MYLLYVTIMGIPFYFLFIPLVKTVLGIG